MLASFPKSGSRITGRSPLSKVSGLAFLLFGRAVGFDFAHVERLVRPVLGLSYVGLCGIDGVFQIGLFAIEKIHVGHSIFIFFIVGQTLL